MRIWSEVPSQRWGEIAADVATLVWVVVWVNFGLRLYGALSELAVAGSDISGAGSGIQDAGTAIGDALSNLPLIGEGAGELVEGAFGAAGDPLVTAGQSLEQILLTIAAILGLLLVAIALIPWLNRYLPWRYGRWRRLHAAGRAIHQHRAAEDPTGAAPSAQHPEMTRLLASRAIHRLEYATLLEFTPDPLGDFMAGHYDQLARAEMASGGLRPRAEPGRG